MGYLKDITNQPNQQTFPGATFEASGTMPVIQCTNALLQGDNGQIFEFEAKITDPGKFTGWNLVGKWFTVIFPTLPWPSQEIIWNDNDTVQGEYGWDEERNDVVYYIHNGGELQQQQTAQSLMAYVLSKGYAATMKGGKLYTDMPSAELALACRIYFNPLS